MSFRALFSFTLLIFAGMSMVFSPIAFGQTEKPMIYAPHTSVEYAEDVGARFHTNHLFLGKPSKGLGPSGGMVPGQLRSFYGMPATGGSGVIAIVDAYDYPTALNDFNVFAKQFGLPTEVSTNPTSATNRVFQVVYAKGKKPAADASWAQESALDIEWAHAMAPYAKIVLVESASSNLSDMFAAVDVASSIPGVREVSMSWSSSEFRTESSYDTHFSRSKSGIVYFAASGDFDGVVQYPAASPYVVGVGGTSIKTDSLGSLVSETGWAGSGGGPSFYERKPSYQTNVANTGTTRSVPDIASDADPNTGVSVYDSTPYAGYVGWMVFGGTSVSSPCMAGMVNVAGSSLDTPTELTSMYSSRGSNLFRDITSGTAGSFRCLPGWDFVTGLGSPEGVGGI